MSSKRVRYSDDEPLNDQAIGSRSPLETTAPDITPRPIRHNSNFSNFDHLASTPSVTSSNLYSQGSSHKAARVSRNSSPTKQLRNAELQETGFSRASFKSRLLSPSLEILTRGLKRISDGFQVLPGDLSEPLLDEDVPDWHFTEEPEFPSSRLPSVRTARKICRLAQRCFESNLTESAWNNDVNSQILEAVVRDDPENDGLLDYRCCLTAQIIKSYRPDNAPSKMVDFCICIQPTPDSSAYSAIQSLCRGRPGLSINHTDWGDLTKYPVAISIETKGPEESYDTALVEVATWHSSQWRSLGPSKDEGPSVIDFLPGIIVIKHDWYFVATVHDRSGKAQTLERVILGSTESVDGIYKLSMALLKLLEWVRREYWPSFQAEVLGFEIGSV